MNLLNLIENTTTGHDNLRALMQASQSGQDAVLNVGGETVTLDPMETRWMFSKYKAFNKAGRQEEFLNHLADPVKFDQHMKQLRQLIDKQKNFRGSVPGERGVSGDTIPGQIEEQQVEEIALQDPNNMVPQTYGKLNWENMIKAYMDNRPYAEFEFKGASPLTIYRTQIYAILKDFGNMKPQQKINIILNTFGDKLATVEYIDRLRQKGKIPKSAPAYKRPDAEPVSPQQMELPGMPAPKIKEGQAQKKNSEITELDRKTVVNPKVARAFQLARARQSAAGSDIEAFVRDELEKGEQAQAEIEQLKKDNAEQDQQMRQLAQVIQQQDQEIDQIKQQPATVAAEPKKPATVAPKPSAGFSAEPEKEKPKAAEKPTEPEVTAEPQQQPTDVAQPVPAKKKRVRKKPTTKVSKPKPATTPVPDNVVPFPTGGRGRQQPAPDELSAALQGVDIGDQATGTYGLREANDELHIGDPVIIRGNVEFGGKTGDVAGFGRDKHFVIVDLYNFGKHAFHASNVEYNNYADQEVDEGRVKDYVIRGEPLPTARGGQFYVVMKKEGQVVHVKQHLDSTAATRHAQNIKNKYPSMEIGVQSPEGYVKWVGISEMQTNINTFNVNRPKPGGTDLEREKFLDARDRLFRQMQSASSGEKEAIRLKIADLEGQAQAKGIKIRESDDLNRAGYNAIKSVSDWEEKMRVMQELMKDRMLMNDPEAKSAIEQRIGDLIRVGQQQGYVNEALNDKAMAVLRSLQQPVQPAPASVDLNVPASSRRGRPSNAQRAQEREQYATIKRQIAQLDELIRMKEQIDKLFIKAQNVRGGIYPGLQADIEAEELYPVPQNDREYQDLLTKYTKDLDALQKFLAMKKAVYREDQDPVSESTALVRLKQARQALSQQDVAEGHADQQRKVFKKNGKPVGEVGIDRESSPGVGQWYMKCYAYNVDNSGYDSYEEAVAELKHCLKQGVSEGICSECGGPSFSDLILAEKQDACYHKVKSRYKVWPSAYASGALVQCRKKGAANWGTGGKKK